MSRQQIIGLIGAAILLLGSFMPIVTMPIIGSINYFQNGKGDGVVTAGIAILAAIVVALKQIELLYALGALGFGVICYSFFNIQNAISGMQRNAAQGLGDTIFRGLAEGMSRAIQLEYGWAVLLIGCVCLVIAAVVNTTEKRKRLSKGPI